MQYETIMCQNIQKVYNYTCRFCFVHEQIYIIQVLNTLMNINEQSCQRQRLQNFDVGREINNQNNNLNQRHVRKIIIKQISSQNENFQSQIFQDESGHTRGDYINN